MHTPVYAQHTRKALRSYGLLIAAAFAVLAGLAAWRGTWWSTKVAVLLSVALVWLLLGLAVPSLLRPIYHAWMWLAFTLNFLMMRVLLTVAFFIVLTPLAVVARLAGRDPLATKKRSSYWLRRTVQASTTHFEKLYVQGDWGFRQ